MDATTGDRPLTENWEVPFARMAANIDEMRSDTQRIVKILEGNGRPGLVSRIDKTEDAVDALREAHKQGADDRRWLWRAVVGVLITLGIGLAVKLVKMDPAASQKTEARP